MKKLILLLLGVLVFITGCGVEYKIHGHYVQFDEDVDFRHIHYRMSTSFDYGSDDNYKSYSLYDKKPTVLYNVTVNKVSGNMEDGIKKYEDAHKVDKKNKKIGRVKWTILSYKEDDISYCLYFASYDDDEYYRIDFYNSSLGEDFEKSFIKTITIK